jgi:ribosomal subunit interface protein
VEAGIKMQTPAQISFHQIEHSDAVESRIQEKISSLEKYFPRITSIKVTLEPKTLRHRKGTTYHVRVALAIPGASIVVGNDPGDDPAHEDIYVAIRDSFMAAKRMLQHQVSSRYRDRKGVKKLQIV